MISRLSPKQKILVEFMIGGMVSGIVSNVVSNRNIFDDLHISAIAGLSAGYIMEAFFQKNTVCLPKSYFEDLFLRRSPENSGKF